MKNLKLILAFAILTSVVTVVSAQKPFLKSETFKVYGNCDMCKSRIEKAAKATDGVASAEWLVKTKMLTVTFDPAKTNTDAISKKVAAAGHDTDKFKASDDVYTKLPGCCHYERR
jgi:periplasmic mercuric ion binding protein